MSEFVAPVAWFTESLHRRICPLYSVDRAKRIHVMGSAVPFRSGKLAFLITAAHVCSSSKTANDLLFTWCQDGPRVLKGARLMWEHRPGASDRDLGLIALDAADLDALAPCYQFTEPADTGSVEPTKRRIHYIIAGYPAARNRVKPCNRNLPALATFLMTGRIILGEKLKIPEKFVDEHFGLSFENDEITTLHGRPFEIPKPQGMSGGGVWRVELDVQTMLATRPKLVGIGIEYYAARRLFVATRVQLAIPLAHDLLDILAGDVPHDVTSRDGSQISLGRTSDTK